MPVSVPHYPSLGLGLLKPAVQAVGASCDIRYFSLDYLDYVGAETHDCLTQVAYYMAHVGEWVFSGAAHAQADAGEAFLTECFAKEHPRFHTPERLAIFRRARRSAPDFIAWCVEAVDWPAYHIIGFTTSFQQTMASLALARRIKQAHPQIVIVFGGINCLDQMGRSLLQHYTFIDAVCLGEGDTCFPELVRRVGCGEDINGIAGMAVRHHSGTHLGNAVADMDRLPCPDYDEFFAQHAASPTAASYTPAVVFETARGCWWGERSHCTFCGLNGTNMSFRAKSQARAYDELAYLVTRHQCRDVANADKILDPRYFESFIPRLAASDLDLTIYYEAKVGMSPDEIAMLARAGIRKIQFGIETFDTELLRLMAKGATMLQNIETLKLCAENGVYVEWLALSGFPGEAPEAYHRLAQLLPKLFHLQPPAAFIRARADRFSPYQRHPEQYGIEIAPLPAYRHIFPYDDRSIRDFANHFTMHAPGLSLHDHYVADTAEQYALWQRRAAQSQLWYEAARGDTLTVHDTRGAQTRGGQAGTTMTLTGAEAALLQYCWRTRRWRDVLAALPDALALEAAATGLESQGLLMREGQSCLALPLRQPGPRRAPSWQDIRQRQAAS